MSFSHVGPEFRGGLYIFFFWTLDIPLFFVCEQVCVFITAGPYYKACVCLLLQDLLQSCARGGGG